MYDAPVLERLVGKPNKLGPLPAVIDTLIGSRLLWTDLFRCPAGGHSLGAWGEYLGLPKTDHSDFSQFSEEMLEYCSNDVEVGVALFRELMPRLRKVRKAFALETRVSQIISRQIVNGYTLDVTAATDLHEKVSIARDEVVKTLQEIFPPKIVETTLKTPACWFTLDGQRFETKADAKAARVPTKTLIAGPPKIRTDEYPFNPGSATQILERFAEAYGWNPPERTNRKTKKPMSPDTGDKALKGLNPKKYPAAPIILEYRMQDKRRSQTAEWLASVQSNGRVHGDVNTLGCVTRRMSHSNPNMGQIPKVDKKKPEKMGRECRSVWIPRSGWKQVGVDASGLEARMLANRMAPYDNGEYIKVVTEGDIHGTNQAVLGLDSRDDMKTWFYAYCYGAGDAKLGATADPKCPPGRRKALGLELRRRFERGLPALGRVVADLKADANRYRAIKAIDGSILPIRSEHAVLNTQLQSDGAIVMKKALVLHNDGMIEAGYLPVGLDENGSWEFLANVHDEFQHESEEWLAEYLGQHAVASITNAGVELGITCPLTGEYKIGNNWSECH